MSIAAKARRDATPEAIKREWAARGREGYARKYPWRVFVRRRVQDCIDAGVFCPPTCLECGRPMSPRMKWIDEFEIGWVDGWGCYPCTNPPLYKTADKGSSPG